MDAYVTFELAGGPRLPERLDALVRLVLAVATVVGLLAVVAVTAVRWLRADLAREIRAQLAAPRPVG